MDARPEHQAIARHSEPRNNSVGLHGKVLSFAILLNLIYVNLNNSCQNRANLNSEFKFARF